MNPRPGAILSRLFFVCFIGLCSIAVSANANPLRVMSFNIRLPLAQDGANAWDHRRDIAADTIAEERPDIVATQELHKVQGDHLLARLPGLNWFGIDRRGGDGDEHMAIFYRRARLRLLDLGNFWLSDTPQVPGSISWDHPYPRMVTWGLFEDKSSRRRFYVFNTHFPHRAEDGEARRRAAELLAAHIAALPPDVPVILAGDFNATPDSAIHAVLTASLHDLRQTARSVAGPEETFHAFTGNADRRIDWILARGFDALRIETVTDNREGRYPSDHFPVVAELLWSEAA